MKKLIYLIVAIVALGLIVPGCIPMVPPAEQSNTDNLTKGATIYVPADYGTIQLAINAAFSGDTIQVAAGTYKETLNLLGKGLSIIGVSVDTVTIDASSLTGNAIHSFGNSTIIKNLKLIGTTNSYGFKISHVNSILLENIKVDSSSKTGVDLHTVKNSELKDIEVINTLHGFGIMILDSDNINVSNIKTNNNAWGGTSVQTAGKTSDGVVFSGTFDAYEIVPFMVEQDPPGYYDITNLVAPSCFNHIVYAYRADGYKQSTYKKTLDDAKTFARLLIPAAAYYSNIMIYDLAKDNYYVIEGMLIQDAVDDATSTTIHVAAGTYVEQIIIDKSITLQGASKETTIIEYPPAPVSDQYLVMVQADDVTITGFKLLGHFATGNMAEYLVHSQGTGLIVENNEIQGFIGIFGNLINGQIRNNIIGTNRKGIYVPGGNNPLNLLIEGNTIEPAEGAGSYASNCGAIYMDHVTHVTIQGNTMQDFSSSTDPSITAGRGIEGSDNDYITIFDNTFVNNRDAITMWIVTDIDIDKNTITNSDRYGINIKGQNINIINNKIAGSGDSGVRIAEFTITTQNVNINFNNIVGNTNYGIKNEWSGEVNAKYNWWGAASGPYHTTLNPTGAGDVVSDNVKFCPWALDNAFTDFITLTLSPLPQPEGFSVCLEAKLNSSTSGIEVDFLFDDSDVGSATTNESGVATLCIESQPSGVYTVKAFVSALPDCLKAEALLAVYDPTDGFVTGGGWIDSPEGAYTVNPSLTGKATFGFVSKYKKGAAVPTGNTEFQFKAGDLNFHSDSYDWLVITGGQKAMYKGTGAINGAGNYGFMLSATDSNPDLFRIKIQDKDTDTVIYDNQMGADDDADPTTTIAGGQIVIHKK